MKPTIETVQVKSNTKKSLNMTRYIKQFWALYLLMLLPMVYFIVFKYKPMAS